MSPSRKSPKPKTRRPSSAKTRVPQDTDQCAPYTVRLTPTHGRPPAFLAFGDAGADTPEGHKPRLKRSSLHAFRFDTLEVAVAWARAIRDAKFSSRRASVSALLVQVVDSADAVLARWPVQLPSEVDFARPPFTRALVALLEETFTKSARVAPSADELFGKGLSKPEPREEPTTKGPPRPPFRIALRFAYDRLAFLSFGPGAVVAFGTPGSTVVPEHAFAFDTLEEAVSWAQALQDARFTSKHSVVTKGIAEILDADAKPVTHWPNAPKLTAWPPELLRVLLEQAAGVLKAPEPREEPAPKSKALTREDASQPPFVVRFADAESAGPNVFLGFDESHSGALLDSAPERGARPHRADVLGAFQFAQVADAAAWAMALEIARCSSKREDVRMGKTVVRNEKGEEVDPRSVIGSSIHAGLGLAQRETLLTVLEGEAPKDVNAPYRVEIGQPQLHGHPQSAWLAFEERWSALDHTLMSGTAVMTPHPVCVRGFTPAGHAFDTLEEASQWWSAFVHARNRATRAVTKAHDTFVVDRHGARVTGLHLSLDKSLAEPALLRDLLDEAAGLQTKPAKPAPEPEEDPRSEIERDRARDDAELSACNHGDPGGFEPVPDTPVRKLGQFWGGGEILPLEELTPERKRWKDAARIRSAHLEDVVKILGPLDGAERLAVVRAACALLEVPLEDRIPDDEVET